MPEADTNEVSVKVAVRIRPLTNREKLHKHQPCIRVIHESNQIVIGKDKSFTFDYVLPPNATQYDLYDDCVVGLVNSVFEGYNATVFAYGQTGSGKTYTICGNTVRDDEVGIIPRAVKTMFAIMKEQRNRQFYVKVSFMEIYKEELRDLLDTADKDMHIRENEFGDITIHGANEINCTTLEDVMSCFNAGITQRHTGSTNMNEQSSRSHSIFTISIEQRWSNLSKSQINTNQSTNGLVVDNNEEISYLGAKFHFVDLAGSERVGRTGNVGDRFKESIHINSGLLALGNVISALSSNDKKKNSHIPYRDSKITRILKDSLGGNAKTLMICCISPSSCNLDESLNAVKYASRARYIKNKPIVNMDPQTQRFVEMQSEIKALRDELHRQRTQILSAETIQHQHNIDENELKQMENHMSSIQNECDHYKKLVKDASTRFKEISRINNLDESINTLIHSWFELIETSKSTLDFDSDDYAKQKIMQLELQLQQAQNDLKSDEEIFSDKEKEISDLKEKIKDLEANLSTTNRYLESAYAKEKEQKELMVQLQIQVDRLTQGKQQNDHSKRLSSIDESPRNADEHQRQQQQLNALNSSSFNTNGQNSNLAKQRAKTAPNNSQLNQLKTHKSKYMKNTESGLHTALYYSNQDNRKNRNIFSSPALFSLEKVMQGFRARSQLLAETLEENDNVLQNDYQPSDVDDEMNKENTFVRRGTYNLKKKPKANNSELEELTKSTEFKKNSLKENDMRLKDAQKKLTDLQINIKLKEELIKELVANSKFAHRVNVEYQHRIDNLQKEANAAKAELADMQRALTQQTSGKDNNEKNKLEFEYKKKLDLAQQKIAELETRQKDTIKIINVASNSDKKINDLELALNKMRQQQEILQKKIKEDNEKKIKLEKDLEKEQQKIKDLQSRNDQQQKILKKKTEDLAAAQRKLRLGSSSSAIPTDENGATTNSKQHWLEQEMEKIIQEKKNLEQFRDELSKREELCKKKELLLQEKNEIEIKKLRSSQKLRESINLVSQKIDTVDRQLKENPNLKENLQQTHNTLIQQRKQLDERLGQGCLLSPAEERRLIELEEAIEAIEEAVKFETDSIKEQKSKLKQSRLLNPTSQSMELSEQIMMKLSELPYDEAKYLVRKFFEKIIDLKEVERKKQLLNDELQLQLEEKTRICDELKRSFNYSSSELDKRLTIQQQQHEKELAVLMDQLNECNQKILNYEKEMNLMKRKTTATKRINNIPVDDYNDGAAAGAAGDSIYNHSYGENNRKLVAAEATNGFQLNEQLIAASQLTSARTVSSSNSIAATTYRQSTNIDFSTQHKNGGIISSATIQQSAALVGLSTNTCKDSLLDHSQHLSSQNHDSKQLTVVKVSKKDLRQLTDAEILKRSKKSES